MRTLKASEKADENFYFTEQPHVTTGKIIMQEEGKNWYEVQEGSCSVQAFVSNPEKTNYAVGSVVLLLYGIAESPCIIGVIGDSNVSISYENNVYEVKAESVNISSSNITISSEDKVEIKSDNIALGNTPTGRVLTTNAIITANGVPCEIVEAGSEVKA